MEVEGCGGLQSHLAPRPMDAHACMSHSHQAHPCRLPPPLTHTAFQTTWLGHSDSPQRLYSPSSRHTHTPPPTLARTPELELLQSPAAGPQRPLQRCVFPADLTPSTVFSGNWCLTRLLRHIIYLFPLPPAQTLLSGELQPRRRLQEATGHRRQRAAGGPLRSPRPAHQAHRVSPWP